MSPQSLSHFSPGYISEVEKGVEEFQRGNFAGALKVFVNVCATRGESADVLTNIGGCYIALGTPSAALPELSKALEIDKSHAGAWNNLGQVLREMGHTPEAYECFTQAVFYAPADCMIGSNLCYFLLSVAGTSTEGYGVPGWPPVPLSG